MFLRMKHCRINFSLCDSMRVHSVRCVAHIIPVISWISCLNAAIQASNPYIHNWPLQPLSYNYDLASHTVHVVCVNFIYVWRDLQHNEQQTFEKLCHDMFINTQSFVQKFAERKSRKKYIYCFSYFVLIPEPGFTSNKPTLPTRLRRLLHIYLRIYWVRKARLPAIIFVLFSIFNITRQDFNLISYNAMFRINNVVAVV